MKDLLRYDKMVEAALRGVVREALARTAANGLPGAHHFYITFKTGFEGVEIPASLRAKHPEEMTIVLEHQFWDLDIEEERFGVTLSFAGKPERLVVPFEAILSFADPAVKFGLQFQQVAPANEQAEDEPAKVETPTRLEKPRAGKGDKAERRAKAGDKPAEKSAEVVTLDQFRKK
ncbi:MAG TPA: ClpXP protease specificity-enhancing factor SspB [Stellaceae bacterium]|nr:ClpXP protease specificity-enhancing factor SspB [Stellaceae bacterium]